jgi:ATP-dependent exoDNAse (exonuclease V) alpha subunit
MNATEFGKILEEARRRKATKEALIEGRFSQHKTPYTEEIQELEKHSSRAYFVQETLHTHPETTVDLASLGMDEEKVSKEQIQDVVEEILYPDEEYKAPRILGVARDDITLNEKQQEFLEAVVTGDDTVLIGAAGTGKTTSMRATSRSLIDSGRLQKLNRGTKYLIQGKPGGAILSYTRKAVNNIRHAVVDELKDHTITIHKLLEFAPIYYEIMDPENPGLMKKTMRFEPTRNEHNPLPEDLTFLAFEESSMVSVELYQMLQKAMPHPHQEVFLGDIQQLPPVFGLAILGFKLVELPVVELTEVYRQALNSPIISLAWKLLEGNPHDFSPATEKFQVKRGGKMVERVRAPALEQYTKQSEDGEVKFQIWQKPLSADLALITTIQQFQAWIESGYFKYDEDIILCPFMVSFGTTEINKGIAQYLGRKRGAVVHEVIAGPRKHYLAVGDRVLYDKEDAFIERIVPNGVYLGKRPQPASINLDREGRLIQELTEQERLSAKITDEAMDLESIEAFIDAAAVIDDKQRAASHIVTVRYAYNNEEEQEEVLEDSAEINALMGGYAITVHKAQGSEWDKVFLIMHQSYATMNSRELLYTAVTRAKQFLHIIAERDTFFKGVKSQRIKGNTVAEKAKFFMGKKEEVDALLLKQEQLDLHHTSLKDAKLASPVAHDPVIDVQEAVIPIEQEVIEENAKTKRIKLLREKIAAMKLNK